jgi:predicted methyltransferase
MSSIRRADRNPPWETIMANIKTALILCSLLATAGIPASATARTPPSIVAAVADPARPKADTDRDAARKPAAVLAFAGVRPGQTVAEILPGAGYFTRLLARAVGPRGHVYAIVSASAAQRPGGLDAIKAVAAAYPNVTLVPSELTRFTVPVPVDLVWTSENYHDLHNGPTADPAAFDRAVFEALKPGGIFYVEDHSAPGTGTTATSTLHRIDPQAAKAEIVAAGFRLDGTSTVLGNASDSHSARSNDPSIRGLTDKFVLRFRKPR